MSRRTSAGLLAAVLLLVAGGCARDLDLLDPAPFPSEGIVFDDGFGAGVGFQAFAGSKLDALQIDQTDRYQGTASLRATVPVGSYAGGAFVANIPRDLSGYNALTFWAKAANPASLDVVGIGNNNTGTSLFTAQAAGLALTTSWRRYVVPLPSPEKLDQEDGLFFFAEGPENGQANTIWFDEVQFEQVGNLGAPRPAVVSKTVALDVGGTAQVDATVTFAVGGQDVVMAAAPAYFTYQSSNQAVATVSATGLITMLAEGSATITASLGNIQAAGAVEVSTGGGPETAAPTPTRDAADVISLFSDAYTDVTVDTWSAVWDAADVEDVQIAGNAAKKYTNLSFAGIEFTSAPVDATGMTHFHMDVWTPDPTAAPALFKIKLVDFGANGIFGGGDDVEHEISLNDASSPAMATEEWASLDIPLSAFGGLTTRGAVAQLIISGDPNTVFVDNVYFFDEGGAAPTEPTAPAPTPTRDPGNVISLFSNAYTNQAVDTWSPDWDQADVADVQVAGDDVKKYTNLVYAVIDWSASGTFDASSMTHFHMDVWTPDPTADPAAFKIKLVDFGADGAYGGGDDVEHEIVVTAATDPALTTGAWVSVDVPLSAFTNLTTREHMAQIVISGDPSTVFVDNVYFHN